MLTFVLETNFPKFQKVPDQLIKCRSMVVRVVHLYSFKFAEEFKNYMNHFFEKIWGLVCNNHVQAGKQNEKLIQEVVRYLGEMVTQPEFSEFFKSNLLPLFQLIILPNISIN